MRPRNRKINRSLSASAAKIGKPETAEPPPALIAPRISAAPEVCSCSEVAPIRMNQTIVAAEVATTPVNTTVRTVRPRDRAARNSPANGAQENHHDQFQTVQAATQSGPMKKLIGTKLIA